MNKKPIQISEWTPDMEPSTELDTETKEIVGTLLDVETSGFGANKNTNQVPEFVNSAHTLFGTIRLENDEMIALNRDYGTIHFPAICNPNHVESFKTGLRLFTKTITDILIWRKNNLFVPNFLHYGHNMTACNELMARTKIRMLSDSIREIQWIDRYGKSAGLEPIPLESVFKEIIPDANRIIDLLGRTHFTIETLRSASSTINHALNLLTIIRNTITPEAVAGWLDTDQNLPTGLERLEK